jgi:hypothetical protein
LEILIDLKILRILKNWSFYGGLREGATQTGDKGGAEGRGNIRYLLNFYESALVLLKNF